MAEGGRRQGGTWRLGRDEATPGWPEAGAREGGEPHSGALILRKWRQGKGPGVWGLGSD